MFTRTLTIFTAASLMLVVAPTFAHDASLHKKKNAEKPNCLAIDKMDHSKIDMNDPVMQAIMKQCMETDHHENMDVNENDSEIDTSAEHDKKAPINNAKSIKQ